MRLLSNDPTQAGSPPSTSELDLWRELTSDESGPLASGSGGRLIIHQQAPSRSPFEALRTLPGQRQVIACLSDKGTGFKGQNGRSWVAAEGNLHLSVKFPCQLAIGPAIHYVPALPAVALRRYLATFSPPLPAPQIKWVNDLLIEGKKIAGTLSASSLQGGKVDSLLFGIGLNLGSSPNIQPDPFVTGSCHLGHWIASPPTPHEAAIRLITELQATIDLLASSNNMLLYREFLNHLAGLNQSVAIYPDRGEDPENTPPAHQGTLTSLDPTTLGLILDNQNHHPITSGRLAITPRDSMVKHK